MNKWGKIAQLLTLISTLIALSVLFYIHVFENSSSALKKEELTQVVKQGEEIKTLKNDVKEAVDIQSNTLLLYDERISGVEKRIGEVEETQTEFLTIMAQGEKQNDKEDNKEDNKEDKPETKPETPVQPTQPETKTVTVMSKDGLHLRTESSSTSQTMGLMPYGTKLTVLEGPTKAGNYNWYKVKTGTGRIGWVATDFVQ